MRRLLSYLWLPITAAMVLLFLYGGLTIADLKYQNQNLEQKQKNLEKQITQLESDFSSLKTIQVAGTKDEPPKTKKTISIIESSATPTPQLTPTPKATLTSTPTAAPTSTPTPTPSTTLGTSPIPTPALQATVAIENVGTYIVDLKSDDTAFSILLRAANENGFSVEYQTYEGMGAFVSSIAGISSHDNYYWAFYYNNAYSMVGASAQAISNGDTTAWKFESF